MVASRRIAEMLDAEDAMVGFGDVHYRNFSAARAGVDVERPSQTEALDVATGRIAS